MRFLLLVALLGLAAQGAENEPSVPVDVFTGGEDYPAFRIPALLTTAKGTLLAFCEARAKLSDHASNDIVLKRSTDQGRTWGALQLLAADGDNALGNPTAVLVRETGRVLLLYQRYAHGFDEHRAEPGLDGPRVCRTFLTASDDDGTTWAAPAEITASVKRPTEVTSTAAGPGIGIQLTRGLHAGRVLMPFNQGPYGKWKVYAVISDDRGATWHYGATAEETTSGYANEVQFAELSDGTVLLNARNQGSDARVRKIARSRDGGETWTPLAEDAALIDPACQASLLRVPLPADAARTVLLFSNPASSKSRDTGTVRASLDDGVTWPHARIIYPGSFAYSCLAPISPAEIGCLFERDGYKKISFIRFPLDWLTADGK